VSRNFAVIPGALTDVTWDPATVVSNGADVALNADNTNFDFWADGMYQMTVNVAYQQLAGAEGTITMTFNGTITVSPPNGLLANPGLQSFIPVIAPASGVAVATATPMSFPAFYSTAGRQLKMRLRYVGSGTVNNSGSFALTIVRIG
jgi:hypothetical protein